MIRAANWIGGVTGREWCAGSISRHDAVVISSCVFRCPRKFVYPLRAPLVCLFPIFYFPSFCLIRGTQLRLVDGILSNKLANYHTPRHASPRRLMILSPPLSTFLIVLSYSQPVVKDILYRSARHKLVSPACRPSLISSLLLSLPLFSVFELGMGD